MPNEEAVPNPEHHVPSPEHSAKHKKRLTKKFWVICAIILGFIAVVHLILQPAIFINKNQVACGITVLQNKFTGELKPDNRSCYCMGKMTSLQTNNIGVDRVDYCDGIGISTINLNNSETQETPN